MLANEIDDFHLAASEANESRYFSHFAAEGVFLGTDAHERWTVDEFRAYAHPHFAKGKAWSMRSVRRTFGMAESGTTAWTSLGDLAFAHLANITRLAVSPNGQWLALVAEPQERTAVPLPAAANMRSIGSTRLR